MKENHRFFGFKRESLVTVLIIFLIAIAWELSVSLGWLSSLFFPPPSVILSTLIRLILNHKLVDNTGITLWRVYVSLVMTALLGIFFNVFLQRMAVTLAPWKTEQRI